MGHLASVEHKSRSQRQTVLRSRSRPGRRLNVVGLFAGVGGIELGLHRAGHETLLLCEIDPAARAVLSAHWPSVPIHEDVRTLRNLPAGTELVTAGFPCQDLSQAGMTAGISGKRSRLVEEVFRILEQHRSPLVLLENVPFMLRLGRGRALDVIVGALERLGYRWAYRVVDSRAFGLPQRRERVFLVAALEEDPRRILFADDAGGPRSARAALGVACGFYWTEGVRGLGWAVDAVPSLKGGSAIGIPSPPAIVLPSGEIVTPELRDAERIQGFPADWTKPAEEVKRKSFRWTLVGNAVTVGVAEWLGARLARPGWYASTTDEPLVEGQAWPPAAYNVGKGRFVAEVSAWPKHGRGKSLEEFLRFPPKPLSVKATAGFYARTQVGSLRFPPGFIATVVAHLERMRSAGSR